MYFINSALQGCLLIQLLFLTMPFFLPIIFCCLAHHVDPRANYYVCTVSSPYLSNECENYCTINTI